MSGNLAFIVLALVLLFLGAESLVRASASLALRAGLSPLMVGLTIVAFGTSSPELVVSVEAALSQQGDISVGNVVGSNSFNIGVILGLTALVCPIPVHRQTSSLVPAGRVAMNEPFASGTIEELDGALLVSCRGTRRSGLLERCTQRRTLRAITDSGCPRLPKVLGGRSNSGQGRTPVRRKTVSVLNREA